MKTGREVDLTLKTEMRNYLFSTICFDFSLSQAGRDKKVLDVDDLLGILHYHWSLCNGFFPTERQRIQLALLLLLISYTGVRPSAVLEMSRDKPLEDAGKGDDPDFMVSVRDPDGLVDCLKYKDIELYKVKDPAGGNEHVFLMVITFRLMKGHRNTGVPHKIVFHERDDNLAFCPVLHVLSLAFADQAFRSRWIRKPADLFSFDIQEERGLQAIPLEWKDDILATPLFRKGERAVSWYQTSATSGWTYHDARNAIVRLGKGAGLKNPLAMYDGRRGFGEAIDKRVTEAVRNKAMGHSRGDIFARFYTNRIIAADTISAFLGTASQDWAVKAASHLSLTRDPLAEHYINVPSAAEIGADSDVQCLALKRTALKTAILAKYQSIRGAAGSEVGIQYKAVVEELRITKKRVKVSLYEQRWAEWFAREGQFVAYDAAGTTTALTWQVSRHLSLARNPLHTSERRPSDQRRPWQMGSRARNAELAKLPAPC